MKSISATSISLAMLLTGLSSLPVKAFSNEIITNTHSLSQIPVTISGNVLNDPNGLTDNTVNGAGTNAGGLNVILYDSTLSQVVAVTAVAAGGAYTFSAIPTGNKYVIALTTGTAAIGAATIPARQLPVNWAYRGENIGAGAGSDGIINGLLPLGTLSAAVSNANFGVQEVCSGSGTMYSLSNIGLISAFTDPALSGVLQSPLNPAPYAATTSANALGYNPVNGKFYYFNVSGGTKVFVSYDPSTNTYASLSTTGVTGISNLRGCVSADGLGYYTIDADANFRYYNIATNTWTTITNSYRNQSGGDISFDIFDQGGGDIAIDGSGNLWLLTGTGTSSTCYVYKISGPLPTTAQPFVTAKLVSSGNVGSAANGIALSAAGEIYITVTSGSRLFRINNDYSISYVGALSNGSSGDMTSCTFPASPLSTMDFGDAPESYNTTQAANGPRHVPSFYDSDVDTAKLMLGSVIDMELNGVPASAGAAATSDDQDNKDDEDGITGFPIYGVGSGNYQLTVNVRNTTGTTANLKGWIDFNNNGVFDPAEAATTTVPAYTSSALLSWSGIASFSEGTYARFRIATNAAEIANPDGLANDGEVEDYYVTFDIILPVRLLGFDAVKEGDRVQLYWATAAELNNKGFGIERSSDGVNWDKIGYISSLSASGNSNIRLDYQFEDRQPLQGTTYYRLLQEDIDGKYSYSPSVKTRFATDRNISIYPNPAREHVVIKGLKGDETILLHDMNGRQLIKQQAVSSFTVMDISLLPEGAYIIYINTANTPVSVQKIIKMK